MTTDIDQAIEKYLEYKLKFNDIEKKIEKYKKMLKQYLQKQKIDKYDNAKATVTLQKATKTIITKKSTPQDIWEKYATQTKYEILNVRKKKL